MIDEVVIKKKIAKTTHNLDTQSIIDKWKQSRKEEEERFQESLLDEEFVKRLDLIKGQIVKNESGSAK